MYGNLMLNKYRQESTNKRLYIWLIKSQPKICNIFDFTMLVPSSLMVTRVGAKNPTNWKKLCPHSCFVSNKNHKPPGLFWMQIVVRKTLKWKILQQDKRKRSRVSIKNSLMPKWKLFFTKYIYLLLHFLLSVIVFIKHRYTFCTWGRG